MGHVFTQRKKKSAISAVCEWPKCSRRVRFVLPLRSFTTGPNTPTPLAIRCAYCLRVFCLRHAYRHFQTAPNESNVMQAVAEHGLEGTPSGGKTALDGALFGGALAADSSRVLTANETGKAPRKRPVT